MIFSRPVNPDEIAAIIIEPVAGNMGCIPPEPGFLESLRYLCDQNGALLIFDEVMTGFRLAAGGAQQLLGVDADIVTYGKVIGGGLPVGAFAARDEIMDVSHYPRCYMSPVRCPLQFLGLHLESLGFQRLPLRFPPE